MQRPVVSVVIPTHNDDPSHLKEAVGSALGQNHEGVEVILVDDGSTQVGTIEAIEEIGRSPRVAVVRQANAGPAAARNAGVEAGSGRYILTLDGDDRINRGFVDACLNVMAEDVVFAYSQIDLFWDDGRRVALPPPPAQLGLSGFMGGNRASAAALFRRTDWESVGGFTVDPALVFEDYDFWVRLLRQRDGVWAVNAPGAVLEYRQRGASRRSSAPAVERELLTRTSIAATSDEEVLRRMLLASWRRVDELQGELQMAWDPPRGPVRSVLRRAWRRLPGRLRDRI